MTDTQRAANELGEFLRARRAELRPSEVGLPPGPQARRVPGLRREEVAQLAGISIDYYNRLEQGRLTPSRPALAAVARSLKLDTSQIAYLQRLSNGAARHTKPVQQVVGPQTLRLVELICHAGVIVLGRYMDVLAWNRVATELFLDFATVSPEARNMVHLTFLDERIRSRYAEWELVAKECVSYLRMDVARYPSDPRLNALVGELSVHDTSFRTWWAEHRVAMPTSGQKKIRHPVAGLLVLDWQLLPCAEDPEQALYVMTAAAGTATAAALQSWES
jgi:transcriptional regulator with XRE-family HTH domain